MIALATASRMACAALLAGSLLLPAAPTLQAEPASTYARVPGALPAAVLARLGVPLGTLPPGRALRLALGLASRDPRGLDRMLQAVYDRRSSLYHHYLSPDAYGARFGPDPTYVQALSAWLRSQGLRPAPWHGGHLLEVAGNAGTVSAALHLRLLRYRLTAQSCRFTPDMHGRWTTATNENATAVAPVSALRPQPQARDRSRRPNRALAGCDRYAADGAPSLPAALAGGVLGIGGLDNVVRAVPQAHLALPARAHIARRAGYGPSGGMDPSQVQAAYDYLPIYAAGFHGERLAIDMVELAPYDPADIAAYAAYYHVNPTITETPVDGGGADQAPSLEPTLDIEELATAVPVATLHVYSAPNDNSTGILHAFTAVAQARDAAVVHIGWAICEQYAQTLYGFVEIAHATLKQMALEGMTVVAPTGDSGAYACGTAPVPTMQGLRAVALPASDPYVTAIGGTVMTLSPTNTIASETAWSCPNGPGGCGNSRGPLGTGSGGGLSVVFGPNDAFNTNLSWQTGPGVRNNDSNGYRQVPDVSISGTYTDGNSLAYSFYYQGKWQNGGGTSAAAPMWAALLLLADQYLLARGQQALGWANRLLYQLGAGAQPYPPYHDITSGTNLYYLAAPGWDYATGWGSPDAWNVVRDIGNDAPPPLPTFPPPPPPVTSTPTATPTLPPTATSSPSATPTASATATPTRPRPTPSPTTTPTAQPCPAAGLGNGGFEAGSLVCWRTAGLAPRLERAIHHGGKAAVVLGAATPLAHPQAATLSQQFTLPSTSRHPTLHLVYWLTRAAPACSTRSACRRVAALPPQVSILDSRHLVIVHAALAPHRERAWSGLALPFPPRPGRLTLQITLPAQPPRVAVLVYVDDVYVD